ncbi:MAG: DUF2199 domain-containing protein [Boseongicola sp.]|nr:DUF2199 domain-containing protein [Boseongicola sp.]
MELNSDPRWRRFNDATRTCPCCGQGFQGIFDIGYDHPQVWPHGNREASGQDILEVGRDRLGTDLCEMDEHYFVRAILPIPIIGTDQYFAFGPWGSVSEKSFKAYVEANKSSDPTFDGCFSWLMNDLPGFEMDDWLPCDLEVEDPDQRPRLYVHEGTHELANLQRNGMTFDRLLDVYAAAGQDIRPHLMDA